MAGDIYDELANLAHATASITSDLLQIESEPPPDRSDTVARLNYALDALVRYREGVTRLDQVLREAFDRILEA